jgi:hypothetical protein
VTNYLAIVKDSKTSPPWLALCASYTPVSTGGRTGYALSTEQPETLEQALSADPNVIRWSINPDESYE